MKKSPLWGLLPLSVMVVFACQKEIGNEPMVRSDASALRVTNPNAADWSINLSVVENTCASQKLKAQSVNPGGNSPGSAGKTILKVYSDASLSMDILSLAENDPVIETGNLGLAEGTYYAKAIFFLGGGNPPTTVRAESMVLPFTVSCGGGNPCNMSGLQAVSVTSYGSWDCSVGQVYQANFRASVCEGPLNNPYKLQGGLTNGTTLYSIDYSSAHYMPSSGAPVNGVTYSLTSKQTGNGKDANNVITWVFSLPGASIPWTQEFYVRFTKSKSTKPADYATGSWSLKDAGGNVVGTYTDRLIFGQVGCN